MPESPYDIPESLYDMHFYQISQINTNKSLLFFDFNQT